MLVDLEKDILMQDNQNHKDEIKELQQLIMKASNFAHHQGQTAASNTTLSLDIMKPRLISSIFQIEDQIDQNYKYSTTDLNNEFGETLDDFDDFDDFDEFDDRNDDENKNNHESQIINTKMNEGIQKE